MWLRIGKVGGSESFIRNLIAGFGQLEDDFRIYLIVAEDNADSFAKCTEDYRFELIRCKVNSSDIKQRILFQNFKLPTLLRDKGIYKCLEPIYSVPFMGSGAIEYYTVIHDLQALHFPRYFSRAKLEWLKLSWKNAINKSKKIVAISNYTKRDIEDRLNADSGKIKMIYNPVVVNEVDEGRAKEIIGKYGLQSEKYFFCVTSMMPHKNINILLDIMRNRADDYKLLICSVGGKLREDFVNRIEEYGLKEKIVFAAYVDDETRDAFYQECRLFLFPSIFEGFGMPPVEALLKGKPVITTLCTSIPEVTMNEAVYVDNPEDASEWNVKIDNVLSDIFFANEVNRKLTKTSNPYTKENAAKQYLKMILKDVKS